MLSYGLKPTFKALGKRKPDFQTVIVHSSFKGSNEMPVEGNCVLLVSDIFLGLEKNKSKKLGKSLQEGFVSVCQGYKCLTLTAFVLQEAKCLS